MESIVEALADCADVFACAPPRYVSVKPSVCGGILLVFGVSSRGLLLIR